MHKNPPKQRFITCGTSTSLEGISIVITLCLKRLLQYGKSGAKYCNAYKPYFIVDNREEIINFLTTMVVLKAYAYMISVTSTRQSRIRS